MRIFGRRFLKWRLAGILSAHVEAVVIFGDRELHPKFFQLRKDIVSRKPLFERMLIHGKQVSMIGGSNEHRGLLYL